MDRQIELTSLRTANSKTFDLGGGKKQVTVTMHRQHYLDGATLKDIDTKWESEVGFGEKVQKADYHLTYKDRTVRFGFSTGVYVEYHMPCDMVASGSELKGQISKDVSIRYLSTPDGVKMEIVLEKCPLVAPVYNIPITLTGCTLTSDMIFVAEGKAVGQIPAPYMTDGTEEIGEVGITLGKGSLAITPDFKWLQSAVYPVTIDPTTTVQVGAGADDGYGGNHLDVQTYTFSNSGTDIRIGLSGGMSVTIFSRFMVNIPVGSTITSATINYLSRSYSTAGVCAQIYCSDEDDAVAPATWYALRDKPLTAAYVDWDISLGSYDTWHVSPDISSVVQEIIGRSGWASGNHILILFKDNGSSDDLMYRAYEYSDHTYGPKLVIEYTEGSTDITVSPPTATATAQGIPPTITAYRSATVSVPTATATAQFLAPTAKAGRSAAVQASTASANAPALAPIVTGHKKTTVSAPTASATADALTPTITGHKKATVHAPTAAATAEMLTPTVHAARKATVQAPTASATASMLIPTVKGRQSATVQAPTASATAGALPPTVTGRRKATAQALTSIAQATALAPSASASSKTTVHAATATATAEMLTPSVQAKRKAIVQAPVASATVEVLTPTVTARQGSAVLAPTATATASMLAPAVKASRKATVQAPTATATASALNPAVSGGTGASVHAPTAEATASMLPPTVAASRKATVQAPAAQTTVTMILPVVLAKRHARATVPTMTATASALAPTVRGRNPMNAIKRIDVVFAERHGKSVVTERHTLVTIAERQGETRFDA